MPNWHHGWTKMDLINELAAIHGYRSYLEICTPRPAPSMALWIEGDIPSRIG
jgi:hypothetical protein